MSLSTAQIQYVADQDGEIQSVILPIKIWHDILKEIASERETNYLLSSARMKMRLAEAKERTYGISLDDAIQKLGI